MEQETRLVYTEPTYRRTILEGRKNELQTTTTKASSLDVTITNLFFLESLRSSSTLYLVYLRFVEARIISRCARRNISRYFSFSVRSFDQRYSTLFRTTKNNSLSDNQRFLISLGTLKKFLTFFRMTIDPIGIQRRDDLIYY